MSVAYEPVMEERYDVSYDEDEERSKSYERPEIYFMQMASVRGQRWPKSIGIVQIFLGFLISFLGAMEVFAIPLSEGYSKPLFKHKNCFGAGLWAGLVMVLTGSTAVRAALSNRKTTVYRFYNLNLFSLVVFGGLTIFLIVAYCLGWTTTDAYLPGSRMHAVHMFVTGLMVMGLIFSIIVLILYHQLIVCNLDLWRERFRGLCSRRNRESDRFGQDTPALLI